MKKMKKKKLPFLTVPAALLAASALLLAGSTAGSARAALTYFSEDYSAQVSISRIGVSLEENGEAISSRDYTEDNTWAETQGVLFSDLFGEDGVQLGKPYDDTITVRNSGDIDTFVRVTVTRSWLDGNGNKDTSLDPDLICLGFLEGNGWVVDEGASTKERTVLYYANALAADGSTAPLLDKGALTIDSSVGSKVIQETEETDEGTLVRTSYAYDGYQFYVGIEADAVQARNAQDAIKSAWGVDVQVSEDGSTISLQ